MAPVVAPPQVAIGAIGRARRVPKFEDDVSDVVVARLCVAVSWAADHRVVDGATMARYQRRERWAADRPVESDRPAPSAR